MKFAQQLLISDKATFDLLTPTEQKLWTTFETADIYRFLTGEEDTVHEFQYNWTSVPRLQPLGPSTTSTPPTPANPAPPVAPPASPLPPVSLKSSGSSTSPATSMPHSSPAPSTSGTRPKQPQPPMAQQPQLDPSGASTSGKTPQTTATKVHNLRQRTKVDYKDVDTGASQFGRAEFQKRCSRAGASVRKSVAKVRKITLAKLFLPIFPKFVLNIYGLLKMSQGQQLPDPDPELINAKSLDFAKPKLFFKNIGRYAATSTYIHVRIPFNFSQILDTRSTIKQHYNVLLDKHEEPFKTIAKMTRDVSLITISASIEDFQDVIKALPQTTEIDMPGQPKCFVAIGIAIAAMALSSFNANQITELNNEISALKSKTDLLLDISHLHKAHLHHLEENTDAMNKLLADFLESNIWFTTKITDAVEKKFQSMVHHHENVVKSAQHHRLAPGALPHDVLDEILNHTLSVAKKRNMVSFVNYASDLFQVEVPPTDVKLICSFVGLCNFFRTNIKDFAVIATPLFKLIRKDSCHNQRWMLS
jgi:hypothetical protein